MSVVQGKKTTFLALGSDSWVFIANCGSSVNMHGTIVPNLSPTFFLLNFMSNLDESSHRSWAEGVDICSIIEPW